ncbi:50S ribosomal protein L11 methyltransferase [Euzebya sp.]|uniref:50S ribosomal protein L11 methyltransferase n=1 Tax=Euzebya sp. TaxID=1971409 RepID=UPI0035148518
MGLSWAYRIAGVGLDEVSDALDVAGIEPAGISEEAGVTTAWFPERLAGDLPLDGRWEAVADEDWSERWKDGLEPVTVGRVTVTVPWLAPEGPVLSQPDHVVLVIEPGMAFGTGHHETTAACLAALQDRDLVGRRLVDGHVVDVGTGTGVLALAARALGAASVTAVDTDPEAIAVARANLAAHGLEGIDLREGSTEAVDRPGDVVVANIITDLLLALVPDLVALVAPGGVLVASGIAADRVEEVRATVAAAGVETTPRVGREWAVLVGQRSA